MKVLVIDDHPLILQAMRALMQQLDDNVEVVTVGAAQPARDTLAAGAEFDLALLDLDLGAEDDGFALLEELRGAYPTLPIVIVAASDRRDDVMRAIDLGAMGFVPKCAGTDTLLSALGLVLSGGIYLPPSVMRGPASHEPAQRGVSAHWDERADSERAAATIAALDLTPRQKEVLALLLRGQSNKLIARALNLSVETIKDHVAAVLRALNVSTRTQAVVAVSQMTTRSSPPSWRQPQQAALRSQ